MPGLNVDPAEALDLKEIILNWRQESVQAIKDQGEAVAKSILSAQSAPMFETRTFELTAGTPPVVLLGYDRARVRSLVRASVADVFIGTLAQLSGGLAYPLPVAAGDEIKTMAEVYVAYIPESGTGTARVTAWIERNV